MRARVSYDAHRKYLRRTESKHQPKRVRFLMRNASRYTRNYKFISDSIIKHGVKRKLILSYDFARKSSFPGRGATARTKQKIRVKCYAPLCTRGLQLIVGVKLQVHFLRHVAVTINHRDEADKRVTSAILWLTRRSFRLQLGSLTIDCILWER